MAVSILTHANIACTSAPRGLSVLKAGFAAYADAFSGEEPRS